MRVVGVDLGRRRIGLALSDRSETLATPWRTVRGAGSVLEVADRLVALLTDMGEDDGGLAGIVVGLPVHLDGRPHEHAVRTRAIAAAIEQRTGLPVTLQDERLTSVEAAQRLAVRERDWRKRKERLDAASAAIILQDYLDEHSQEMGDSGQETGEA
jgi:putative Holliday junction resolvase